MKKIVVMLNYCRSGGTMLLKILGSLKNTITLSEINPNLGIDINHKQVRPENAIKNQLKLWYNIDIGGENFQECIAEIAELCYQNDLILIIRDWTFCDYNYITSIKHLSIIDTLKSNYDLTIFAFVRDVIDVYLSQNENIDVFSKRYLEYVKDLKRKDIKIFKYENIVNNFENELKRICDFCDIQYDNHFENLLNNEKVTGDIQIVGGSRGGKKNKVVKLPRKWTFIEERKKINSNINIYKANELLNYPTNYESIKVENILEFIKRQFKNKFIRIFIK